MIKQFWLILRARFKKINVVDHITQQTTRRHQGSSITDPVLLPGELLPPPKKEVMFSVRSVCLSVRLSVCPSDYSETCERILTKFFGGVGHGSRTKWYNFGGDLDHASDPGVQSPKSGSAGSAEVCSLWVHSCFKYTTLKCQIRAAPLRFTLEQYALFVSPVSRH